MIDGGSQEQTVECGTCSFSYCAGCELPPHQPATCQHMVKWIEKGGICESSKEDVETIAIKHRTTKPCPCVSRRPTLSHTMKNGWPRGP